MTQRGPLPKPTELKVLEGNRGHRPVDLTATFRPAVGVPTMPRYLTREARKAWRRLSPELVRYNLLSKVHADAFAMLCQTIGRLELIETALTKKQALLLEQGKDPTEALMASTPKGLLIQSVTYQVLNREMEKLRTLIAEFGLTPAQQARVTTGVREQLRLFEGGAGGETAKPAEPAKPAGQGGFAEFD